jgi:hypothetical protein
MLKKNLNQPLFPRNSAIYGCWLLVSSFFALQGEKRTHNTCKSTMLPQAKAASA